MAQLIDLGKLRFEFRGQYSPSTEYESNDVVRYGGNLYVYTNVTKTTGNEPTDTSFWALMLEGFDFQGEWDDTINYQLGDVVTYGGKVFISNIDNINETPGAPTASGETEPWSQLVDGIQYEGAYNAATEYQTGDVVTYGGITYIAVDDTVGNAPTNTSYWDMLLNGVSYEGAYNSATAYKVNDIVTYGGGSYICKVETTGNEPTDSSYWDIFVEGIQYEGTYNNSTNYQIGDVVNYGGIVYICIADTVGNAPTNTSYWSTLIEGISYKGIYSGSTEYNKNDIVSYDGSSWIAVQNTTGNAPADPSAFWDVLAPGTFPSFVGNEGYFLSNNGSAAVWTADLAADSLDIADAFYVGEGAKDFALGLASGSEALTNPVATFRFDNNSSDSSFAQLAFQNADPTSSTDIIAYMDNGSDSAGWMGMGITGSEYDDATYGITAPGDGYLFLETSGNPGDYTGNMVFATGANGSENKLVFAAGGFDSGLTQMEITPGVNVHVEIPTPSTSPTTGALTVVGGVGIQGDMNIAGNVDIVGQISFGGSGTTVETQNLAVSDPTVYVGSNNLADAFDLGIIAEYAEDVVDQVTSVSNKALTNNVATLTTSTAHGYSIGDVVVITDVDAVFDGTYVIKGVPTTTTFTYNKTNDDVTSTAVSPTGTATVTHERRWGGVVRDVTDGVVKIFVGSTEKPSTSVNFSNPGLSYANLLAGNGTFAGLTATGTVSLPSTTSIGNVNATEIGYLDGVTSAIQTQISAKAPTDSPTFTGLVTLPTGSTSVAPLRMVSGSLKTTPAVGEVEYDGKTPYFTHTTGLRSVLNGSHFYSLTATRSLTNATGVQSLFGVGLSVAAATTYEFEIVAGVSTTGATSNALQTAFGGTATLTSIGYMVNTTNQATSHATVSTVSTAYVQTAAATTVTAAAAAATYRNVWIKGLVRVNATGTFIPQVAYTAAPGAAPVVAVNSYIKMTPLGSNTVTTVGAWA